MTTSLEQEFQYYLDHQADLARQYAGKVLVIKGGTVIGVYDSEIEAIEKTTEREPIGTFLVQRCDPDPDSTVQTYRSRVQFA